MKTLALLAALLTPTLAHAADKPFDPSRDPAQDLAQAQQQAMREHKNILLDVGGNWCPWCIVLDRTLAADEALHSTLAQNYVVLHVNWSRENKNEAFLHPYPAPHGFPAWYVLSPQGQLLKAEDTAELESTHTLSDGYNKDALATFLTRYAPHP